MLKKITLNLFNLTIRSHPSSVIIVRNYVPRYVRSKDPGIENRKKDFGEMLLEHEDDPEFLVS